MLDPNWCPNAPLDAYDVQCWLKTFLEKALEYGHLKLAEDLVERVIVPDTVTMYYAIRAESTFTVRALLEKGVSVTAVVPFPASNIERVPMAEAFRIYSTEIIDLLHTSGVIASLRGNLEAIEACMSAACETGRVNLLEFLLCLWGPASNSNRLASPSLSFFKPYEAIERGHHGIVGMLLSNGWKPIARHLQVALQHGKLDSAEAILDYVLAKPDLEDLLHFAVKARHPRIIQSIVASGTSIDACYESGSHRTIIEGLHPSLQGRFPPLSTAIFCGYNDIVRLLLEMGASLEQGVFQRNFGNFISPLLAAVHCSRLDLVSEFLSRGVNPSDEAAITEAVLKSCPEILELLINACQVRRSIYGGSLGPRPLIAAIERGDLRMIQDLVTITDLNSMETDLNSMENAEYEVHCYEGLGRFSPFGAALAYRGAHRLKIINLLISEGVDMNVPAQIQWNLHADQTVKTPFLIAINARDLDTVKLLVSAGASVHDLPRFGVSHTPLQAAVKAGALDIVDYLLQQNVDVNAAPAVSGGRTALQIAAENGFLGLADLLINKGADVNAPRANCDGRTAFEAAAEKGRIEMLMYLVEKGADIISDGGKQYRNSLFLAKGNRHVGVRKYVEMVYQEQCLARSTTADLFELESGSEFPDFDPVRCQF